MNWKWRALRDVRKHCSPFWNDEPNAGAHQKGTTCGRALLGCFKCSDVFKMAGGCELAKAKLWGKWDGKNKTKEKNLKPTIHEHIASQMLFTPG